MNEGLKYFPPQMFSPRYGAQIFTFRMISMTMQPGEELGCCSVPHVQYSIHLKQGKNEWTIEKRFSEFHQLHCDLTHKNADVAKMLPILPSKTIFPITYCSEKYLSERFCSLNTYLDKLLQFFSEKNLLDSENPIVPFLELQPNQ